MAFKKKGQENVQAAPTGIVGKEVDAVIETPPVEQQPKVIKGIRRSCFINGRNQEVIVVEEFPQVNKSSVTTKLTLEEGELWVVDGRKLLKLKEGKQIAERRPGSDNPNLARPLTE